LAKFRDKVLDGLMDFEVQVAIFRGMGNESMAVLGVAKIMGLAAK
jgi:hypothetical protein